jgi:hypothetical protein
MARRSKLYGISEYLMIMHEVQKARLARRTPHEDAGVRIRGADSYLNEGGKIVAQTIHYTKEEKRS